MDVVLKYFNHLSAEQIDRLVKYNKIFTGANSKINLVSRKDIVHFPERHLLHSLGIARFISFQPGTRVLDAGTGGGLPGIPLAILFPGSTFHLMDATAKKLKAVESMARSVGLDNVTFGHGRLEDHTGKYDYVVGRAVTALDAFCKLVFKNIDCSRELHPKPGVIYLKGGDFKGELDPIGAGKEIINLSDHFSESFFETKKVVYLTPCS